MRVKTTCKTDCESSPKKRFLRDFNIAAARGHLAFVEKCLAPEVTWHLYEPAGQKRIYGKKSVAAELKHNLVIVPAELVLETVVTHGDEGAVNGTILARDKKSYVFCDIYKFTNLAKDPKIKEMTSYIIEDTLP